MVQLLQRFVKGRIQIQENDMRKAILTLAPIALLGFAAGRMAVRLSLNALLGGSAFGGNIL